jgi:hypothetical protein
VDPVGECDRLVGTRYLRVSHGSEGHDVDLPGDGCFPLRLNTFHRTETGVQDLSSTGR